MLRHLADSLPAFLLTQWENERERWLQLHPTPWDEETAKAYHARFTKEIEEWLDQGSGSCVLRDPAIAEYVVNTIRHDDGKQYELNCFVVMPNHVHVLFRAYDQAELGKILKTWKGVSARRINQHRGAAGEVWQADYWDLLMRNERHFLATRNYILRNPEKAGLRAGEYWLEGE